MSECTHVFAGRITRLVEGAEGRVGRVSVEGAGRLVALDLVPEARAGDTVLVHAGVALSMVRDDEGPGVAEGESRPRSREEARRRSGPGAAGSAGGD